MIWIDTALKSAALASTIIATLRAGSRMAYLLEHDAIGVMEGPVIRNTNESYPLFELSEAFRHCVRLSIVPDQYENVQTTRQPVVADVEPYPLSPRPYISHVDKEVKKTNDTTTSTKNRPRLEDNQTRHSFWKQQFNYVASALPTFPSSISNTRRLIAKAPHVASFLGGKFWNRRRDSREKSQIDDEGKV